MELKQIMIWIQCMLGYGGLIGMISTIKPLWVRQDHDGDDIINMILDRDECALHICKKLYKWFLYDHVDLDFIDGMASVLRSNNYEIKPALEYLFSSEHFYDPTFYGTNVQNPVQLYLGTIKRLKMEEQPFDTDYFTEIQNHLDMILFEPPDE